ncbi:MAG: chromate transporter [Solobacterium sp.]|nr:chromate transporter [Solobacterium sp.]
MKVYLDLFVSWFKMGLFTFGGGYAMLPMIQREVIEKHHWATEDEVMDYYAIGQCTPGIIAVNTATFIGYKVKGILGGIIATLGVVSPSLIIITLITALISNFSQLEIVQHALRGIQVAVCVLMFTAIEKLLKKGVTDVWTFLIFAAAFLLSSFTDLSTVILVILAGIAGYVMFTVKSRKKGGEQA